MNIEILLTKADSLTNFFKSIKENITTTAPWTDQLLLIKEANGLIEKIDKFLSERIRSYRNYLRHLYKWR